AAASIGRLNMLPVAIDAEAGRSIVDNHWRANGRRIVAELVVEPVEVEQLRIAGLAVLIEAEFQEPIGERREVPIEPAGELAGADEMVVVEVDRGASAAVGGKVQRVALLDVQDVVLDRRARHGARADELLRMRAAELDRVARAVLIDRIAFDAGSAFAVDPDA